MLRPKELMLVATIPNSDKDVVRVQEKPPKHPRNGFRVYELEDEAAPPNAELKSGRRIVFAAIIVRNPLNAKSDDKTIQVVAMEV